MGFTQPLCTDCWYSENPHRDPPRVQFDVIEINHCCLCNRLTSAGIWTRKDPTSVPHPYYSSGEPG